LKLILVFTLDSTQFAENSKEINHDQICFSRTLLSSSFSSDPI